MHAVSFRCNVQTGRCSRHCSTVAAFICRHPSTTPVLRAPQSQGQHSTWRSLRPTSLPLLGPKLRCRAATEFKEDPSEAAAGMEPPRPTTAFPPAPPAPAEAVHAQDQPPATSSSHQPTDHATSSKAGSTAPTRPDPEPPTRTDHLEPLPPQALYPKSQPVPAAEVKRAAQGDPAAAHADHTTPPTAAEGSTAGSPAQDPSAAAHTGHTTPAPAAEAVLGGDSPDDDAASFHTVGSSSSNGPEAVDVPDHTVHSSGKASAATEVQDHTTVGTGSAAAEVPDDDAPAVLQEAAAAPDSGPGVLSEAPGSQDELLTLGDLAAVQQQLRQATANYEHLDERLADVERSLLGLIKDVKAGPGAAGSDFTGSGTLGGSLGVDEDDAGLGMLHKLQSNVSEALNSGYMQSVKALRESLLAHEWELHGKHAAARRGVSNFEQLCAEQELDIDYDVITALYNDPFKLDIIPDKRQRSLARSIIETTLDERHQQVYKACTDVAKDLANKGLMDLVPTDLGSAVGAAGKVAKTMFPLPGFLKK